MSMPIFWEKNKKNIISLSSAEFAQRVVKVNAVLGAEHSNYILQIKKHLLILIVIISGIHNIIRTYQTTHTKQLDLLLQQ